MSTDLARKNELIGKTLNALSEATYTDVKKASERCGIPNRKTIIRIIKDLQALLFEGYFRKGELFGHDLLSEVYDKLGEQICAAFSFTGEEHDRDKILSLTEEFIACLPLIKEKLHKDIEALYAGDPAARCREEVLICYPGFYAISIYRFAHKLYKMGVPLIPRIMTEYAHEKTGIDIHAGAEIGESFFIDHGTGIVIGETTTIGDRVKLYQGVTLGAKSFELDGDGNPVKGIKRHPDIGNDVIIYANATILGGNTRIGDRSIIGGNVWITSSVEPDSRVVYDRK